MRFCSTGRLCAAYRMPTYIRARETDTSTQTLLKGGNRRGKRNDDNYLQLILKGYKAKFRHSFKYVLYIIM